MTEQATQNVDVFGDENSVKVAGRDINITEQYYSQEAPDFLTPNLDTYKPPEYESPRFARKLVDRLEGDRLLLLSGSTEIRKSAFARHLSWKLSAKLQPSYGAIEVKEWRHSSDTRNLATIIEETEPVTIFILADLEPQHVYSDLHRLRQATRGQHYVVCSTDIGLDAWQLDNASKHFCQELILDEVFDEAFLERVLQKELKKYRTSLPKPFNNGTTLPEMPLIDGVSIQDISAKLGTPDNISIFIDMLRKESDAIDKETLNNLIETCNDPGRGVRQIFQTLPDIDSRLLSLGFSFLAGLPDDQAFAGIEQIYLQAWKARDNTLRMPDYCDFDLLHAFFSLVKTDGGLTLVENRFQEQRRLLLKAAWRSHRRQILAALPVLAHLVAQSVASNAAAVDREIFGSRERRRRFRDAAADTLSDIGLISADAAEDTLLSLAADKEFGVQAVAARAMARWRRYGADEQLFGRIEKWQRSAYATNFIRGIFEGEEAKRTAKPEDFIRATIALVIGYAAQYDPKNALSERLARLMDDFAIDPSPLVRDRFHRHTLPQVVALHVVSMEEQLRRMIKHLDPALDSAIASSLAYAYRVDAPAVTTILDNWYQETTRNRASHEFAERESLLVTIVLTHGLLDYGDDGSALVTDPGAGRLKEILEKERHPLVREAVIVAIAELAKRDFNRFSGMLKSLITKATLEEKDKFVRILERIFLKEREDLEGGEDWVDLNSRSYPLWFDKERPLTSIEKALLGWIRDGFGDTVAQQIAFDCSVRFQGIFQRAETARIEQIRDERIRAQVDSLARDEDEAKQSAASHVNTPWFIPWWVTKGNEFKPVIRNLLPRALSYKETQEDALKTVLERWSYSNIDPGEDNTNIKRIAGYLKKALRFK
uniref:Uncharacterized protein n=1 Tax=Candidatus Kentrum sp. MB TaxID=2138164 RepID=A0A451BBY5_9GAMM|nr:MAG: hypothetical protein BECKMB1821G_GA0114241_10337 [Candidatus Kentron sp. MB]VFK32910.1 MAG: hypothetical protein BECKMB1821I_GA0114274_10386 [Candidatus Kentron sp. MB]VFK75797.1 MAG: hypothetical protein BECKMB1821H_GA0114242_10326 [Candidatus Kentron sp. MB]